MVNIISIALTAAVAVFITRWNHLRKEARAFIFFKKELSYLTTNMKTMLVLYKKRRISKPDFIQVKNIRQYLDKINYDDYPTFLIDELNDLRIMIISLADVIIEGKEQA